MNEIEEKPKIMKKILYIFMCIFSFIFIYYLLINMSGHKAFPYLAILGVIVFNILAFVADGYEKKMLEQRLGFEIRQRSLEYQEENIKEIKLRHEEIEKRNHDFNKSITIIQDLLLQKNYTEAEKYVDSLSKNNEKYSGHNIYSGNIILNTLLNRKLEECKEKGIDAKCFVCGRTDCIEDIDLYYLFANLLDNAINAAQDSEKPHISIMINASEEKIYGEIVNSIRHTDKTDFKELIPDNFAKGHGYGLSNIYEIIAKKGGDIQYSLPSPELVKVSFNIEKTGRKKCDC